jgi:uncharacterized membrane protein YczE
VAELALFSNATSQHLAGMPRRLAQLVLGLCLYGSSIAMMVRAGLGLGPWAVFHQGLSQHLGLSIGLVTNGVGALLLLLWIPLRQWPGIGTIANVLLIGTSADVALGVLPPVHDLGVRVALLVGGVLLNGVAGGLYIGAGLGPGPRDGLMTGGVRLTGLPLARVRTGIELIVLALGWLLGGTIGVGTVLYALSVGPLLQTFLPLFQVAAKVDEPTQPAAVNA